jgi:hypothetical protein
MYRSGQTHLPRGFIPSTDLGWKLSGSRTRSGPCGVDENSSSAGNVLLLCPRPPARRLVTILTELTSNDARDGRLTHIYACVMGPRLSASRTARWNFIEEMSCMFCEVPR